MTMPKFESVAEVVWYDPALRMTPEPAGKIIDSSMSFIESAAIGTKLYPFDQLTEAYEAGAASRDAEVAELVAALKPFGAIDLVESRLPAEFAMLILRARAALAAAKTQGYSE